MWLANAVVLALTALSMQIERVQTETCAAKGLKEVSVESSSGIYCVKEEPCAGSANAITRFGCPVKGQLDVTGRYKLDFGSCCAMLSDGVIGCVMLDGTASTSKHGCLPAPSWFKGAGPDVEKTENPHDGSDSGHMLGLDDKLSEQKDSAIAQNKDVVGDLRSDREQPLPARSSTSTSGMDGSYIALIVVLPSLAIAAIAGGILLRTKSSRSETGLNDSRSQDLEALDDAAYYNIPLTPKEEVHLL